MDFVGAAPAPGSCAFGARGADATVATTQFNFPNIGTMHQAVLDFGRFGLQTGDVAWCACSADGGRTFSANTSVVPITAGPPRAAIFADFGLANDVVMSALAADAGNEAFGACGLPTPHCLLCAPLCFALLLRLTHPPTLLARCQFCCADYALHGA